MRQAEQRTLAALGFGGLKPIKMPGLRAFEALDQTGRSTLIFRGSISGPSWPSIIFLIDSNQIPHTTAWVGKIYLVIDDTASNREFLGTVLRNTQLSNRNEVFITDVGFAISEVKRRFEYRILIAPLTIFSLMAIGLMVVTSNSQAPVAEQEQAVSINCAIDLDDVAFSRWISDQVKSAMSRGSDAVVIKTQVGTLSLTVKQSLGKTLRITATLSCDDGRSLDVQFRTDSSGVGDLVKLGSKLDS